MKSVLCRLNRSELEFLIDNCNFSEDEIIIFRMTSKEMNELQIADKMNTSESTVTKKKKKILVKILEFVEEMEEVTTIYVNGKRVTKDELKNYEIRIENVKKILAEKLTKTK